MHKLYKFILAHNKYNIAPLYFTSDSIVKSIFERNRLMRKVARQGSGSSGKRIG